MEAMKPLHIATSVKIVSKHLRMERPNVMVVRDRIQRLARSQVTAEDQALALELQAATRMSMAQLAELTKEWPLKA
jgi:hypothetical protein